MPKTGKCLCGSVSVSATTKHQESDACHCSMCQKWGGSAFIGVELNDDAKWTGTENISVFSSSEWAERGFCSQCGTHLFYRLKGGGLLTVPLGLLDNHDGLELKKQIFIEEKSPHYSFSNDTKNMTGAEVMAAFQQLGDS